MSMLRRTSARWDTPDTPRTQRHAFGVVVFSWLIGSVAIVVAVLRWELLPLIFSGWAIGTTVGGILRHRQQSQRPAETERLRPYQPTDADNNPLGASSGIVARPMPSTARHCSRGFLGGGSQLPATRKRGE
jgi:hypothetical protein